MGLMSTAVARVAKRRITKIGIGRPIIGNPNSPMAKKKHDKIMNQAFDEYMKTRGGLAAAALTTPVAAWLIGKTMWDGITGNKYTDYYDLDYWLRRGKYRKRR